MIGKNRPGMSWVGIHGFRFFGRKLSFDLGAIMVLGPKFGPYFGFAYNFTKSKEKPQG